VTQPAKVAACFTHEALLINLKDQSSYSEPAPTILKPIEVPVKYHRRLLLQAPKQIQESSNLGRNNGK